MKKFEKMTKDELKKNQINKKILRRQNLNRKIDGYCKLGVSCENFKEKKYLYKNKEKRNKLAKEIVINC